MILNSFVSGLRSLAFLGTGGAVPIDRGPLSDFWYRPLPVESQSGVNVTVDLAIRVSTAYACVKLLSETIGSLPLFLYEMGDDTSRKAVNHPLYRTLHSRPNQWQTIQEWLELAMNHLCWRGNFICRKVRRGVDVELWPLSPDAISIEQLDGGDLRYKHKHPDGTTATYLQEDMLHVRMMSLDGIWGLSPLSAAREAIGLAVTTEGHGANFFKHRAIPGMVLNYPAGMSPEAQRKARETIAAIHAGFGNHHRTMILPSGVTMTPVGISNEDAQFLETRGFQISEIARFFLVPPHMIGAVEKVSSWGTGIEQQTLGFVKFTTRPYNIRFEQSLRRDLLEPLGMAETHKVEFSMEGLLRGDSAGRAAFYKEMFQTGAFSTNDILRLENMDPIGEDGDQRFVPANMMSLAGGMENAATRGGDRGGEVAAVDAHAERLDSPAVTTDDIGDHGSAVRPDATTGTRGVTRDAAARIAHANIAALKRRAGVAGRDRGRYEKWVLEHCSKQRAYIKRTLTPLAGVLACDPRESADAAVTLIRRELLGGEALDVLGQWETDLAAKLEGVIAHEQALAD